MAAPQFSVVIPTYNRGAAILDTIDQVLSIDHPSFEVVVVDDGSTDETAALLDSIEDERVRVIHRTNGGISAARNTGVEASHGEFVVPLDDDDVPLPHWLADFSGEIERSEAVVVSGGCDIVDAESGRPIDVRTPRDLGPAFSGYRGHFMAGSFAVNRDVYSTVGGFAEGLQCSHQTEFALRLLAWCRRSNAAVGAVDRSVVQIRRRRPTDRAEASPQKLLSGTEYILAEHEDKLSLDPAYQADFHAIAGVNAFRLKQAARGRCHFAKAARLQPRSVRHLGRFLLSRLPLLPGRVWSR